MIRYINKNFQNLRISGLLIIVLGLLLNGTVKAQEKPPRPIKVTTYQNLSFGSIILGFSGGTVTMSPTGIRSVTGDLILPSLGSQGSEAIFEIKSPPGSLVTLVLGNTTLTNGAHSMNLSIGPTDPISPFITSRQQGQATLLHVGGTLSIGNESQNPAGNYTGIFTVTFIQQ